MGNYAKAAARAVRTLTDQEQVALLRVSGEARDGFRDHVIFSVALGTGLREHELVALNVGDVVESMAKEPVVRQRIVLTTFKGCGKASRDESGSGSPMATSNLTATAAHQEVVLPDLLRHKLGKYLKWRRTEGESVEPDAPLFVSRIGNRLSLRQLRHLFHLWQQRAGFERRLPFHALRHTACSTLYRNTKDIRLTQRFARHASVVTTSIYAHPSDEDLLRAVRGLAC